MGAAAWAVKGSRTKRQQDEPREPGPLEWEEWDQRFSVDPLHVFEHYWRVKHRDRAGQIVPLLLRAPQRRFYDDLCLIVARAIRNSARKASAWEALSLAVGHRIDQKTTPSEAIRAIRDANPWRVARELEKHEWFSIEGVRILVGKARQQGLSTLIEALLMWLSVVTPNTDTLVMASEEKNSQHILSISHLLYAAWPEDEPGGLERQLLKPRDESASREKLAFDNGSSFEVQTAGGRAASRGFHFNRMHFSEFAHFQNASIIAAALAGAPKHCWIFKESTANGPTGPFAEEWGRALTIQEVMELEDQGDTEALLRWETEGQANFCFFCSWLEEPDYHLECSDAEAALIMGSLDEAERALLAKGATPGQLKWRRWKKSQLRNDLGLTEEQFFAQEFPSDPHEMFQTTGKGVFDAHKVAELEARSKLAHNLPIGYWRVDHIKEPEQARPHEANLRIWALPRKGGMYLVSVDPAQGLAHGDWSVIKVFDRMDGSFLEEVACYRAKTHATPLGDIAVMLAEMYNQAFLICDSVAVGQATLSRIIQLNYSQLYREMRALHQEIDPSTPEAWTVGCHITSTKKSGMVPAAVEALRGGYIDLRSPTCFQELRDFERTESKGGGSVRFAAPKGKNDDEVMAIVMAWHAQSASAAAPRVTKEAVASRLRAETKTEAHDQKIWAAMKELRRQRDKKVRRHGPSVLLTPAAR